MNTEMVIVVTIIVACIATIINMIASTKKIVTTEKTVGYIVVCNNMENVTVFEGCDNKGNFKKFYFEEAPSVTAGAYKIVNKHTKEKLLWGFVFVNEIDEQKLVPVHRYEQKGFYNPSLLIEGVEIPCYTWNNSKNLFKDAFAPLNAKDFAETVKTVFAE